MQEEGIVKRIDGSTAKVAFVKKGGCGGGCSSCKSGCPKDTITVELINTENASVGDRVLVDMDNKSFSNMAFWAYCFPAVITLVVLCISLYFLNKAGINNYEVYSILIGLAAMVISYAIGGKLNKNKDKFGFKMIKILKR